MGRSFYLSGSTLVALLVLSASVLHAQNLTAPLLSGSWQSTYHNPAMVHFLPTGTTVGLPGLANDLRLENLQYRDIFARENGQRILQLDSWSLLANEENGVQDVYSIETLGLAVRTGRFGLSGYHRLRVQGDAAYPKSLVDLFALGNVPFIGRTVDIAPRGEVVSFQELGLGLSYAVSDKVAIAGRVKYLAGVSSIQIGEGSSLDLTTDAANFGLTLEQDLALNTVRAISYEQLNRIGLIYNPSRLHSEDLFTSNNGMAFDLGVAVNLDRLRLNASATDLGAAIDWQENITGLRFRGSRTFSGLDLLNDLLRDSVSFEEAVDSLTLTFEPEQTGTAYRSEIGASYYLGGEYDVTDRFTAGAMVVLENRLGDTVPAFALVGRYTVLDWLRLGVNLNHRTGIRTNIGLHLYASPGRFRLFASSDKFITLISTGNSALAGIRLGAALMLGPTRSSSSFLP
ncbi:hypothetical protein GGR28_003572 [Lewinella aquimaris]|uniref:DUF5723 domain-containing protein n=1 Tax=Neolewinella aquimaris TaxID=1835722 RepID=A0A840EAG2_9BACT|nr:DUF5723 family protein [Neolewinella aquimaris]MBB4080933.1 hypothetical protein [Neolewinella aquimaris]